MKFSKNSVYVLIVLLSVLAITGCGGAESRKAKYLERSKNYLEEQNYDKAAVELKNVLQIDPKYAEAYYYLGKVEESRANWQKAFANYSKAVELDPDYFPAQASIGRFYLLSGDAAKAEEIEQKILAKNPEHPEGKTLKAAILLSKKDVTGAIKLAQEVISADPKQVSTTAFLADIYLRQKQPDKARETLEKGVAANPDNPTLRLLLSRVYFSLKNLDKAEEQLKILVSQKPDRLSYQSSLIGFYRQTKQLDKAESLIRELIKKEPEDPQRHLLLVQFLAAERDRETAEKYLVSAVESHPKLHELRFNLAAVYDQAGKPDMAEKQYRTIIDDAGTEPPGLRARTLLASLLLKQGKPVDEPEKIINEVLKENPRDNDALLLQGKMLVAKRKPQDAIVAFRTVLKDNPNSDEVLTLLGNAHLLNGETGLAKESLQKALELNPKNMSAKFVLARYYANTNDYDAAIKLLDEILKSSPKDLNALQAEIEIFAAKRDLKRLQDTLVKVKEAYPDNPLGYYQLGQFYMAQGRFDAAIREYELMMKKSRADVLQPLVGIVNAYVKQGKQNTAITRLTDLIKGRADHPYAHGLLAQLYIAQKRYHEAEKELREAIRINPRWNGPYIMLANLHLLRGEPTAADEIYQQGLRTNSDDVELMLHAAQFYEGTRDFKNAVAMYERALQKQPNSEIVANNLAALLTDQPGDAESLKRARELAERFQSSPQPAFRDTLGWVYYKSGEVDKAVAVLKDVVKQSPNVPIFNYHLGMVYYKKGDLASAKFHLTKALGDGKAKFTGADEARETLKTIP